MPKGEAFCFPDCIKGNCDPQGPVKRKFKRVFSEGKELFVELHWCATDQPSRRDSDAPQAFAAIILPPEAMTWMKAKDRRRLARSILDETLEQSVSPR